MQSNTSSSAVAVGDRMEMEQLQTMFCNNGNGNEQWEREEENITVKCLTEIVMSNFGVAPRTVVVPRQPQQQQQQQQPKVDLSQNDTLKIR